MQHVGLGLALAPEPTHIGVIANLQYMPLYVVIMEAKEILDVVPVNRKPPVIAKVATDRLEPPQGPKTHSSQRRPASIALPLNP